MKASRYPLCLIVLLILTPVALMVAAGVGPYSINVFDFPKILLGDTDSQPYRVLMNIRFPRVAGAALIGAALAVSGTALQGLFRNPLADPTLIGIMNGSALGAAAWIVIFGEGRTDQIIGVSFAAFVGAVIAVLIVWRIAMNRGHRDTSGLLLAGIGVNAIAGAGIGMFIYMSDEEELRGITFWQLGGLQYTSWANILTVMVPILAGIAILMPLGRKLNAISMGEREAFHMGVKVTTVQHQIILGASLAIGGAVAAAGGVGFVGLIVPHLLRLAFGADHRWLLPCTALLGAVLVITADTAARTVAQPTELPLGVLMALIGGPFFMWLLMRRKSDRTLA